MYEIKDDSLALKIDSDQSDDCRERTYLFENTGKLLSVQQNVEFFYTLLLASLSGAISVLAWAPFSWWPLAFVGYACLFWLLLNSQTILRASLLGFAFGFGLHLFGSGWVFGALHSKTGMALIPSVLSILVFVTYLALFTAIPCLIWRYSLKKQKSNNLGSRDCIPVSLKGVLFFAALLMLGEWARSILFNGFTSLALGYSLIDTWLSGYAPVIGLYGLSWIGFVISGALVALITRYRVASNLIFVVGVTGVGIALTQVTWSQPSGVPLRYRLIQSNIAQERKFDPLYVRQQTHRLVDIIERNPADLIVTPETAFPMFLNELPGDALSRLQQFSQRTGSNVFMGIASIAANSDGYNSMVRIAPNQSGIDQYNKILLMPFGEYSPAGFGWFTHSLSIPLKDLSAGASDQAPFSLGSQRIGTLICHEDLTGQAARHWLPAVTLLINPSNLAWFEGSLAITQRLQIVRMRALESGRPILRVTNTGITAQIDNRGVVIASLPEAKEGVLVGTIQPVSGLTPYMRMGDWFAVLGSMASLLFFGLIYRRR